MNKKKLSIVIPTFNGQKSIVDLSLELYSIFNYLDLEIIIVNDCSPDLTDIVIKKNIHKFGKLKYVRLKENCGETEAVKIGLQFCDYESIIIADDDFQHNPVEIKKLFEYSLGKNLDVIYTKFKKSKHSFFKIIGSKIYNKLLLSNKNKVDYISSFKYLKKKIILNFFNQDNYKDIDNYIINHKKLNIDNLEVIHYERKYGKSNYFFLSLSIEFLKRFNDFYKKIIKKMSYILIPLAIYLIFKIFKISYFFLVENKYPEGYPTLTLLMILNLLLSLIFLKNYFKKNIPIIEEMIEK